jgi:LemA protein
VTLLALLWVRLYNKLVQRRLRVDEGWSQIDVQLKRRHDLIPNLVAAVRGYMEFEEETLTRVTEARASAVAAGAEGLAETTAAENQLMQTLGSLFARVENAPELKANQNVISL